MADSKSKPKKIIARAPRGITKESLYKLYKGSREPARYLFQLKGVRKSFGFKGAIATTVTHKLKLLSTNTAYAKHYDQKVNTLTKQIDNHSKVLNGHAEAIKENLDKIDAIKEAQPYLNALKIKIASQDTITDDIKAEYNIILATFGKVGVNLTPLKEGENKKDFEKKLSLTDDILKKTVDETTKEITERGNVLQDTRRANDRLVARLDNNIKKGRKYAKAISKSSIEVAKIHNYLSRNRQLAAEVYSGNKKISSKAATIKKLLAHAESMEKEGDSINKNLNKAYVSIISSSEERKQLATEINKLAIKASTDKYAKEKYQKAIKSILGSEEDRKMYGKHLETVDRLLGFAIAKHITKDALNFNQGDVDNAGVNLSSKIQEDYLGMVNGDDFKKNPTIANLMRLMERENMHENYPNFFTHVKAKMLELQSNDAIYKEAETSVKSDIKLSAQAKDIIKNFIEVRKAENNNAKRLNNIKQIIKYEISNARTIKQLALDVGITKDDINGVKFYDTLYDKYSTIMNDPNEYAEANKKAFADEFHRLLSLAQNNASPELYDAHTQHELLYHKLYQKYKPELEELSDIYNESNYTGLKEFLEKKHKEMGSFSKIFTKSDYDKVLQSEKTLNPTQKNGENMFFESLVDTPNATSINSYLDTLIKNYPVEAAAITAYTESVNMLTKKSPKINKTVDALKTKYGDNFTNLLVGYRENNTLIKLLYSTTLKDDDGIDLFTDATARTEWEKLNKPETSVLTSEEIAQLNTEIPTSANSTKELLTKAIKNILTRRGFSANTNYTNVYNGFDSIRRRIIEDENFHFPLDINFDEISMRRALASLLYTETKIPDERVFLSNGIFADSSQIPEFLKIIKNELSVIFRTSDGKLDPNGQQTRMTPDEYRKLKSYHTAINKAIKGLDEKISGAGNEDVKKLLMVQQNELTDFYSNITEKLIKNYEEHAKKFKVVEPTNLPDYDRDVRDKMKIGTTALITDSNPDISRGYPEFALVNNSLLEESNLRELMYKNGKLITDPIVVAINTLIDRTIKSYYGKTYEEINEDNIKRDMIPIDKVYNDNIPKALKIYEELKEQNPGLAEYFKTTRIDPVINARRVMLTRLADIRTYRSITTDRMTMALDVYNIMRDSDAKFSESIDRVKEKLENIKKDPSTSNYDDTAIENYIDEYTNDTTTVGDIKNAIKSILDNIGDDPENIQIAKQLIDLHIQRKLLVNLGIDKDYIDNNISNLNQKIEGKGINYNTILGQFLMKIYNTINSNPNEYNGDIVNAIKKHINNYDKIKNIRQNFSDDEGRLKLDILKYNIDKKIEAGETNVNLAYTTKLLEGNTFKPEQITLALSRRKLLDTRKILADIILRLNYPSSEEYQKLREQLIQSSLLIDKYLSESDTYIGKDETNIKQLADENVANAKILTDNMNKQINSLKDILNNQNLFLSKAATKKIYDEKLSKDLLSKYPDLTDVFNADNTAENIYTINFGGPSNLFTNDRGYFSSHNIITGGANIRLTRKARHGRRLVRK